MSARITLSSKLPGDPETNGLDSLADDLIDNPHQIVVALAFFDVPRITEQVEDGTRVPTIRIRKIEPVGTPESTPKAITELYQKLSEERLGREPLPFGDFRVAGFTGDDQVGDDGDPDYAAELI